MSSCAYPIISLILLIGGVSAGCSSDDKQNTSSSAPAKTQSVVPTAASSAPLPPPAPPPPPEKPVLDQSKPQNVLNALFEAAKNGDDSQLASLCEPSVSKHKDVTRLCQLKKGDKKWDEFVDRFKTGTASEPKVTSKKKGDRAKIDFTYGKDGKKKKTMKLGKVGDKWYLANF